MQSDTGKLGVMQHNYYAASLLMVVGGGGVGFNNQYTHSNRRVIELIMLLFMYAQIDKTSLSILGIRLYSVMHIH